MRGSGVLGSAVCMDKVMAKAVLASHGIPQVAYQLVTRAEFASTPEDAIARILSLGFPVFVKPANLGSSVGISKAKNETELHRIETDGVRTGSSRDRGSGHLREAS